MSKYEEAIKNIYNELFDNYKKKLAYLKTYYNDNKDISGFKKQLKAILENDICYELINHYVIYSFNGYEYTITIKPTEAVYRICIEFNLMDFTYIQGYVNMFADATQYYLRKEYL